jgi:MoaA/NifB/PqqE/SkfB family radical SAM enzyme
MKALLRAHFFVRALSKAAWAFVDASHPIIAQIVPVRRCNLACAYCNEYDSVSQQVPIEVLRRWVDRLAELGTACITISGGEPLLHTELDEVIAHVRARGMVATLISNGYYLSAERVIRLNRAGLDHMQISIDNVEPDDVSLKSLRLLEPKLRWLSEHAEFIVNVNTVLGSGVKNPEDAVVIAERARELGFTSSVGVIHDGFGRLSPLDERQMRVWRQLKGVHSWWNVSRLNELWQENLVAGQANTWRCRAGARYLYVDEGGLVHYCSQQRGRPGIPLERYGRADIEREYRTAKPCAPYCTVNCVQQTAVFDNWRAPQLSEAEATRPPLAIPTEDEA